MSHTYSKIWVHVIWHTKNNQRLLSDRLSSQLYSHIVEYACSKGYVVDSINGVADHIHVLVELKPKDSTSEFANAVKGESSHWINANRLTSVRFAWQEGFSVFSVSESQVHRVRQYIARQEEHHRLKTFAEEIQELMVVHGIDPGKRRP